MLSRRQMIVITMATALEPGRLLANGQTETRIRLVHTPTGELFEGPWLSSGRPDEVALAEIDDLMRDRRTDERGEMDPKLLEILAGIQRETRSAAIHFTSAYRSVKSNERLENAARSSLHMSGRAVDIWIPGRSVDRLARSARRHGAGGIGVYPGARYVHVDTGKLRSWRGL